MALAAQFAALTTGSVTHKVRTGISDYGGPSYSTSASTYPAYYEPQERLVTDAEGNEVVSRGRIFVVSTGASINTQDFLAMDNGPTTERVTILRVDTFRDLDGQHHLEVDV